MLLNIKNAAGFLMPIESYMLLEVTSLQQFKELPHYEANCQSLTTSVCCISSAITPVKELSGPQVPPRQSTILSLFSMIQTD